MVFHTLFTWITAFAFAAEPTTAPRYTEADAASDLRELAPAIEALTGRTFWVLPPVRATSRADIAERVDARGPDEVNLVSGAAAMYVSRDDRIYLIREAMDQLAVATHGDPEALHSEIRRVLAHELVHALQAQWTPYPGPDLSPERRRGWQALVEGQAEWAATKIQPTLFDTTAIQNSEELMGNDLLRNLYLDGPRAASAIVERFGAEGLWRLLERPPEMSQLVRLATLIDAPSGPLVAFVAALVVPGDATMPVHLPALWFATGMGGQGFSGDPNIHGFKVTRRDGTLVAYELRMADEAHAAQIVASRAKVGSRFFLGNKVNVLPNLGSVTAGMLRAQRSPHRALALGGDELLTVKAFSSSSEATYSETWFRLGQSVLIIGKNGHRERTRDLDTAIHAFLHGDEDSAAKRQATEATETALAAVDPGDAPAAQRPREVWFVGPPAARLAVQDPARCVEIGTAVFLAAPPATAPRVAAAVHGCAVATDDLATADHWRSEAQDNLLWPKARLQHATLLQRAGRPEEALALLIGWSPPSAEAMQESATVQLRLLLELRRVSAVRTLARRPEPAPEVRLDAAAWLRRGGHGADARAIEHELCGGPPEANPPACREHGVAR